MKMQSARRVLQFATGIAVGAVGFVVFSVLGLIADGLASGVLPGVDGIPLRAIDPIPSWPVGLIVAVLGAGAYALRSLWWTPIAARSGLIISIGLLLAVGIARFRSVVGIPPESAPVSWWDTILVSGSQMVGFYGLIGVVLASLIVDIRRGHPAGLSPHRGGSTITRGSTDRL